MKQIDEEKGFYCFKDYKNNILICEGSGTLFYIGNLNLDKNIIHNFYLLDDDTKVGIFVPMPNLKISKIECLDYIIKRMLSYELLNNKSYCYIDLFEKLPDNSLKINCLSVLYTLKDNIIIKL